jgi:hypothetical protein
MTLEIVPYKGSQEARANRWVSEDPENLRRKTIEAARDRDLETLWEIFEAFLVQDFGPGKHTIKAYKKGFEVLLEQLTALEYQGIHAELKHGVWHSSDKAFAERLTELSLLIGYSAADPHPDATIARGIAARLGARLVLGAPAVKRSAKAIY